MLRSLCCRRRRRIGAWSSPQSHVVGSRADLMDLVHATTQRFKADIDEFGAVPRPPFWGGFRVVPTMVEFWRSAGKSRLHDRVVYRRATASEPWRVERLAP